MCLIELLDGLYRWLGWLQQLLSFFRMTYSYSFNSQHDDPCTQWKMVPWMTVGLYKQVETGGFPLP